MHNNTKDSFTDRLRPWPAMSALVAALAFPATAAEESAPTSYGIGRPADPAAIAPLDIDVMPDGRGLPSGRGNAREGKPIYDVACAQCHGAAGRDGPRGSLAGAPLYTAAELAADRSLSRTVGNYWPYATTLFDYVRRAMPFDRPGSLGSDELYALTAYVLFINDLIKEDETMDATTLPRVVMPARGYFVSAGELEATP